MDTNTNHREASEWARSTVTVDIDAHSAAQCDWVLKYEQLSAGSFQGELTLVQFEGLQLICEKTNLALRQRGGLRKEAYGFAMSAEPTDEVYFDGRKVHPDAIMCGRVNEIDFVTPPHYHLIAITVDRSLLNPLWERMYQKPPGAWLEHQLELRPSTANAKALRRSHPQVVKQALALAHHFDDASTLCQMRDDILIEWIEALPVAVDTSDLESFSRRKRVVDKACELMLAHPEAPLSILDLCSQLGASRRKLNYYFQDVLGTSPTQYLRALRLNGVRRGLREATPGASVQAVATRWGFWHLGQFSLDYKKHFSELPSETLLRARKGN